MHLILIDFNYSHREKKDIFFRNLPFYYCCFDQILKFSICTTSVLRAFRRRRSLKFFNLQLLCEQCNEDDRRVNGVTIVDHDDFLDDELNIVV